MKNLLRTYIEALNKIAVELSLLEKAAFSPAAHDALSSTIFYGI